MNAFKSLRTAALIGAGLAFGACAQANQKICVYDLLGNSGDIYDQAKDYALEMQKHGVQMDLKAYTDERVATEDFRTGQCDGVIAMGLALIGLDWTTALSGAATAVCNVGPGVGSIIGPAGNFSTLPDAAKWLLTVGMLLGRLEILTVLVLLTPVFWKY